MVAIKKFKDSEGKKELKVTIMFKRPVKVFCDIDENYYKTLNIIDFKNIFWIQDRVKSLWFNSTDNILY